MGVCRRSTISRCTGRPAGRSTRRSRAPGSTWTAPGGDAEPEDDGVGVNATIPSLGSAAAAEAALQSVESGFLTLKVKAGAERETEVLVDRVRAIRAAVGPDIRLRLDVNGAWDLATAIDRLEAIARFDIEFVEQPLPPHDIDGMAELRRRVRVPIAADEAAASVRDVRGLLAADAVDALVIKPVRVGGPGAVAAIAELAAERDVAGRHQHAVRDRDRDRGRRWPRPPHCPTWPRRAGPSRPTTAWRRPGSSSTTCWRDRWSSRMAGSARRGCPGPAALGIVLDERALERFRVESIGRMP